MPKRMNFFMFHIIFKNLLIDNFAALGKWKLYLMYDK